MHLVDPVRSYQVVPSCLSFLTGQTKVTATSYLPGTFQKHESPWEGLNSPAATAMALQRGSSKGADEAT